MAFARGLVSASEVLPIPRPILCLHSQRRHDTSPYRSTHRLTWGRLNAAKWPYGGSVAWRPSWGIERPLGPSLVSPNFVQAGGAPIDDAVARDTSEDTSGAAAPSARDMDAPVLLHRLLHSRLNVTMEEALAIVQRGRVTVNGRLQKRNCWIDDVRAISVNGVALTSLAGVALLAHKPSGMALTDGDPLKRPLYTSLLPNPMLLLRPANLSIDLASTGLLVLTSCRTLAATLSSGHMPAVFEVQLRTSLNWRQIAALQDPETYGSYSDVAPTVEELGNGLRLTLAGGRPAQVRRALAAVFAKTLTPVCCVGLGPLSIDEPGLEQPGDVRSLTDSEIEALREMQSY